MVNNDNNILLLKADNLVQHNVGTKSTDSNCLFVYRFQCKGDTIENLEKSKKRQFDQQNYAQELKNVISMYPDRFKND